MSSLIYYKNNKHQMSPAAAVIVIVTLKIKVSEYVWYFQRFLYCYLHTWQTSSQLSTYHQAWDQSIGCWVPQEQSSSQPLSELVSVLSSLSEEHSASWLLETGNHLDSKNRRSRVWFRSHLVNMILHVPIFHQTFRHLTVWNLLYFFPNTINSLKTGDL